MAEYERVSKTDRPIRDLPRFQDHLKTLLYQSEFNQREIASMAGLKHNVLSMIKLGRMKVPLDRIPDLAWALRADPFVLLVLAMNDEHPALLRLLQDQMGISISTLQLASLARTPKQESTDADIPPSDPGRSSS
ncbi:MULTISPECIES: hypothetical protein [unclassified Thioalkalivibrio]|uniref:hypothetical protein n=1 Tax=unclassified Thioalkalivibrio TaxID=2621013 RepID=UPI00037ECD5E|nr:MULTISPECIES: hypothetical protein [unclassified Thioalkalivibrio]